MSEAGASSEEHTGLSVYGGDESYYTGKLEAYLRAKGLAYRRIAFSPANLRHCAKFTGVMQIPQVECDDGTWLVDTTPTIEFLETAHPEPSVTPSDPAAHFIALLLEDYADEWLWRPAMHFRWSYAESARLMSRRLAAHLVDIPLPMFVKTWFWRVRQTVVFVRLDGVNASTRDAVEASFYDTLDALEAIFAQRRYVLGDRPSQADFGFFASMYAHFLNDPAPGRIVRERAPAVCEWVMRLWNIRPETFQDAPPIDAVPDSLGPLLHAISDHYLPYLTANSDAYACGLKKVTYEAQGVRFSEPVKPYRVWCLSELQREYAALNKDSRQTVDRHLADAAAIKALLQAVPVKLPSAPPALPISARGEAQPVDSWWRGR